MGKYVSRADKVSTALLEGVALEVTGLDDVTRIFSDITAKLLQLNELSDDEREKLRLAYAHFLNKAEQIMALPSTGVTCSIIVKTISKQAISELFLEEYEKNKLPPIGFYQLTLADKKYLRDQKIPYAADGMKLGETVRIAKALFAHNKTIVRSQLDDRQKNAPGMETIANIIHSRDLTSDQIYLSGGVLYFTKRAHHAFKGEPSEIIKYNHAQGGKKIYHVNGTCVASADLLLYGLMGLARGNITGLRVPEHNIDQHNMYVLRFNVALIRKIKETRSDPYTTRLYYAQAIASILVSIGYIQKPEDLWGELTKTLNKQKKHITVGGLSGAAATVKSFIYEASYRTLEKQTGISPKYIITSTEPYVVEKPIKTTPTDAFVQKYEAFMVALDATLV